MDGPEAGQTYTCQVATTGTTGGTGATISGCSEQSYLNWASGEPNAFRQAVIPYNWEEDYMHVYGDPNHARYGTWNDFVSPYENNANKVTKYIIEYGGMGGTATVFGAASISITSTEATDNPFDVFDDKELVGIVEGQSESAKRFIY